MPNIDDTPDISRGLRPSDAFGPEYHERVQKEEEALAGRIANALENMEIDSNPKVMVKVVSENVKTPAQAARIKKLILKKLSHLDASTNNKITTAFNQAEVEIKERFSPKALSLKEGPLPEIPEEHRQVVEAFMKTGDLIAFTKLLDSIDASVDYKALEALLNSIKTYDLEIDRLPNARKELEHSTYELRTLCLQSSNGKMRSYQAYSRSINPIYFKDPLSQIAFEFASEPMNFIPERVKDHARVIQNSIIEGIAMSERLKKVTGGKRVFFCLGGNCGVGKTHSAKSDPIFQAALKDGEPIGSFAPDILKTSLRKGIDKVTARQIHMEGIALNRGLIRELQRSGVECAMLFDEQLSNPVHLREMAEICAEKGGTIRFKDIDGPLMVSVLRVLGRDINTEPCMSFKAVANGYQKIRENRGQIVDLVIKNDTVEHYQMYVVNDAYESVLTAEKVDGKFVIYDQSLYNRATQAPKEGEVDAIGKTVIDDAFLKNLEEHPIPGVKLDAIAKHLGKTIEQALEDLSLELPRWD